MKIIKTIFGTIITIVCLYLLVRTISLAELQEQFIKVNITILLCFIPLFILNMFFRTLRWQFLFPKDQRPTYRLLLGTLLVGNLYNSILPARAGDVIRIFSLAKRANISRLQTLASVLTERLLDACFLMFLFFVLVRSFNMGDVYLKASWLVFICSVGLIGIFILLLQDKSWLVFKKLVPNRLKDNFKDKLSEMAHAFLRGLKPLFLNKTYLAFVPFFLMVWLLESTTVWLIAYACGETIPFIKAVALFLFPTFAALIPSSPGQIGIFEYAVVVGASILGINSGITIAIIWHGSVLLCIIIAGLVTVLIGFIEKRKEGYIEKRV